MSNIDRPYKDFGARLEKTISHRATEKATVARECGISKGGITKYCQGWYYPTAPVLQRICSFLDCTAEWLVNGNGSIEDAYDKSRVIAGVKNPNRVSIEKNGNEFSLIVKLQEKEVMNMFKMCLT